MTKTRSRSGMAALVTGMLGAALLTNMPAAAARLASVPPRAAHQVSGSRNHAGLTAWRIRRRCWVRAGGGPRTGR
jgi:hypothetical protein